MMIAHPRTLLGAGLLAVLAAGCSDPAGPVDPAPTARMLISANVAGAPIEILVATVTAADIAVPIVKNLTVRDGMASGTLTMPPGPARTIRVTAFEHDGAVSHEGTATIDVRRGANPGVTIAMIPRTGDVPISVQIGSVMITLSQSAASLDVGSALQLTATIVTPGNEPVDGNPSWATTAPAILSVSRDGLVSGLRPGTAQVVATFAGVAAVATIEVTAPNQP